MVLLRATGTLLLASLVAANGELTSRAPDPCAVIGGQKWVSPAQVRACFSSIKVDQAAKSNIIEVITKTLAFHTSTNYQILAPQPYSEEVHEDVLKSLARISRSSYKSDYDLHIDLSRTQKRLNDGHCVWINPCYDSLYINYLPIPLSLLTDSRGVQSVHIFPQAFAVATAEFPDQIDFWQNALPGSLKGKLQSLDGAKVLLINGQDPWVAVNANALITGSYQAFGTRQNSYFSSYQRGATSWNLIMGNFAQQANPLHDSVTLTLQRVNSTKIEVVTIPYRSRIGPSTTPFTDTASYRANNCVARSTTNGVDYYSSAGTARLGSEETTALETFQQQPKTPKSPKHAINVMLDTVPLTDVVLPPALTPTGPVDGSFSVGQFYKLNADTGVLALGSFSGADFALMQSGLLQGLVTLKSMGATKLIIDVTNNGGGFICVAHFLHRIIIGPKDTTVPQAGLDTNLRAGPLATAISQNIIDYDLDPEFLLLYNPQNWANASGVQFGENENWLIPPVKKVINGRKDAFSQRLGQECQPGSFITDPPTEALFDPANIVIVSNGRCGSSCSLFSITMSKHEGVRTVVLGGKKNVNQQYCGVVGGQSTSFTTIDSEIKTAHIKNHTLAPPDLIVNGVQGITWRLAFGIDKPNEPEEWQNHPADLNLPLTAALANNPVAIWNELAARLL